MSTTNITMAALKKWATDTLIADPEYTALCVSTVGQALNFYRSTPVNHPVEEKPFFTAFSDESEGDYTGQTEYPDQWVVPFAIGIVGNDDYVEDGATWAWESSDKVELLAVNAMRILKNKASSCGILTEDIRVLRYNLAVTEVGAAEDVQANLFITFGKLNTL